MTRFAEFYQPLQAEAGTGMAPAGPGPPRPGPGLQGIMIMIRVTLAAAHPVSVSARSDFRATKRLMRLTPSSVTAAVAAGDLIGGFADPPQF